MSAEEERRYAPDGGYYSYQEFVDFYGGEDEWHNAAIGDYDGAAGDNSGGFTVGKDNLSRNNSDGAAAANSDENSDENSDDDYSDDSQYVPSDAPPEPEPEEIVDWFAELDEDEQDELTEWYDEFLDTFEVYLVLDRIAWEVAMYDPTKDPVWLDEQAALGFWPKQSITYKQKWALGDFFKAMGGAYINEDGIELNLWKRFRGWSNFDSDPFLTSWFGVKIDDITMQVKGLILSSNGLRGTLPLTLGKLHGLSTLTLNRNGLEGEFPESILGCPTLRSLDLHGNKFEGDLPDNLSKLKMLSFVYVHQNRFTGRIDDFFTLPRLKYLNASSNEFSWGIPDTIRKTKQLEKLVLSGNQLMGRIPEEIGVCRNLRELYFDGNQLTGELPDVLTQKLRKLEILHLDSNELEGNIPEDIGRLSRLKRLWLSNNRFRGHVPVSMGKMTRLTTLSLQHNAFVGFIPPFFGDFQRLETLRMDHNDFIGEVPRSLCALTALTALSLGEGGFGDNQKVENFPVTLGTLDHWRKTEVPEREAEMTTDEFVEMSKKKVWELKDMLTEASSATWAHKNKRATRWQEMRKLAARFDNRDMETKKAVYDRPAPGTGPTAEEIKRLNAETVAAAAAATAVVVVEEEEEEEEEKEDEEEEEEEKEDEEDEEDEKHEQVSVAEAEDSNAEKIPNMP